MLSEIAKRLLHIINHVKTNEQVGEILDKVIADLYAAKTQQELTNLELFLLRYIVDHRL